MSAIGSTLSLKLGVIAFLAMVVVHAATPVSADGPACDKWCGCDFNSGPEGERQGDCYGENNCKVVDCPGHMPNCGYDDNYNDRCGFHRQCNVMGYSWIVENCQGDILE